MDSHDQSHENLGLLKRLHLEILYQVIYTLPNADIKNLRLTCSYLGNISLPRFNRVFISANPLDIEVFTLIANHDIFRFKVTEIIYDDSHFDHTWSKRFIKSGNNTADRRTALWCFRRFYNITVRIIDGKEEEYQSMFHVKKAFKTRCTLAESFEIYEKLQSQQDEVRAAGRDAEALRYGLLRFPNLRRITISPASHGILGRPLYLTPTIRSFPEGLVYPLHHDWPRTNMIEEDPLSSWDESSKRQWHGFCVVTTEIAQHINRNPIFSLSEFVLESRQLWTGISYHVFDNPMSEEYRNLVTILSHPSLRRLELSLACGALSGKNWPSFRSGLLFRALSKAENLQDIRFDTGTRYECRPWHENLVEDPQKGMPLQSMFPLKQWLNLRRFALSRSFVKQRDLMALISTLPESLELLELSFLGFFPGEGTYRDLLQDMRCNLRWRERPTSNQPRLLVLVEKKLMMDGAAIDVSRAAMEYVYHHGENPFVGEQIMELLEGKGTPVDLLDPMRDEELYHGRVTPV
ncbi:hypothetical protein FPANT_10223 [Fusarium pseudoanthophilum]|uniref:F-box domain-containing protein n=1 Tax=Fusarium pseudoanthophilum TaxID=48495 RepID=A0A8H5KQ07_9HYPO|nr:hypothetical protein FPANT_10223 [Fusarium pseudoanthophilum]